MKYAQSYRKGHCVHFNLCIYDLAMKTNFEQLFQNSAKSRAVEQNGYHQVINWLSEHPLNGHRLPPSSQKLNEKYNCNVGTNPQICEIMQGGGCCWAVSWLCEHKCTNRGNKLTIFSRRRVEQCETFLAADAASCDPEAAIWSQQSPTWRRQSTHKSAKPPVTGCCKSTLNTTGNRWHPDANLRQASSDRPA